jgi:hypothetical protein
MEKKADAFNHRWTRRGIAATKEENLTTDEHPPSPRLRWASKMDTNGGRKGEEAGNEFELMNSGKNNGEDKLRKARKGERRRETAFL